MTYHEFYQPTNDEAIRWYAEVQLQETMMDINNAFPSKYLKAQDLQGRTVKAVIDSVTNGDESIQGKPVMHFKGKDKGIVLNKTNAMAVAAVFGGNTDKWIGRDVELFSQKTQFNGQMVDAIRVRAISNQDDDLDTDIPF